MSALGKVVRAGLARRRTQTVVMLLTTTMAVTAAVLAAELLFAASAPFATAFAAQRGAHLTAEFDSTKASAAQVAATMRLPVVADAAGPYPELSLRPHVGANTMGLPVGNQLPPLTFVARTGGGPVDQLRLTEGRWATGPGEAVLVAGNNALDVGDTMTFPDLPGNPTLTVVGLAGSITGTADAWVTPATLSTLTAPGTRPGWQVLYRFHDAATDAQVNADRAAVNAAVPAGAVRTAASYLKVAVAAQRGSGTFVPFVTAFGVLGLVMSVLVIGIVVGGAVSSATRRIGILKSIGFSPGQVVRAYLGQAMLPAAAGAVLGAVFGNLLAIPVLDDAGTVFGTSSVGIPVWLDVLVPVGALAVVAGAALVPALRAGRLRTVEAITVGRTPTANRGRLVRGLLGALPLPKAVSLGLASPFARPGRSATVLAAVLLGSIGITFGIGLVLSLNHIQDGLHRRSPGAVVVMAAGGPVAPPLPGEDRPTRTKTATNADLATLIGQQPGTQAFVQIGQTRVGVAGLAGPTDVRAYTGDSSWAAFQLLAGRWFAGPGEIVVSASFLADTGTHVGDPVTLTNEGHSAPVRIVGDAFANQQLILVDERSLAGLNADVIPESVEFDIELRPGVDQAGYTDALNTALAPYGIGAQPGNTRLSSTAIAMDGLVAILTVLLVAVACFGVLSTVTLEIRERVRDIGIYQALGMSPRQTVAMVLISMAGIGLVAGALGVPVGMAVHDVVVPAIGAAAGTAVPAVDVAVFSPLVLVPLVLGGAVLAMAGALGPAGWAARLRTATALRTE